jgi:transposase-like protein
MAKKRNASAADDLIKSLLDDVNGDDSLPKDKLFLTSEEAKATNSIQFPVGLDPKKKILIRANRALRQRIQEQHTPLTMTKQAQKFQTLKRCLLNLLITRIMTPR